MRKALIFIGMMLLMVGIVSAAYTTTDQFTTQDDSVGMSANYSVQFTPTHDIPAGSSVNVSIYMYQQGTSAANPCMIQGNNAADDKPNNTLYSNVLSYDSDAGALEWVDGIFNTTIAMASGQKYQIVCGAVGSGSDRNRWGSDSAQGNTDSKTHSGSGATWSLEALDLDFYVSFEAAAVPVPIVTLSAPANNNKTNKDVNFTFSVSGADSTSCQLYHNGTGSWEGNATLSSTIIGSYDFGKVGLGNVQGSYLWNVKCTEAGTDYWGSSNFSLVIDLTEPTITLNTANSDFTDTNQSSSHGNPYNNSIRYFYDVVDDGELYMYSVNVTDSSGTNKYSAGTNLTGSVLEANATINVSEWLEGVYTLSIEASDSHTKHAIRDYKVTKLLNKLKFDTEEGNVVWIESDDPAAVDSTKGIDRYSFEFDFYDADDKKRTFHVRSEQPINYISNSPYKGHFVVGGSGGGNWIDFEGVSGTPTITYISDYHYIVEFPKIKDKVKFNSIGGLNQNEKQNTFYVGKYLQSAPTGFTGQSSTITLNISGNLDYINAGIIANLTYNGTLYQYDSSSLQLNGNNFYQILSVPVTNSDTASLYYYTWDVMVVQNDSTNILFTTETATHNVTDWSLDNCSSNSNVRIYFEVWDEEDPTLQVASMGLAEILGTYWITPINKKNITAKWEGENNFSLCMDAATDVYSDIYLKYETTYGYTHRYLLYNQSLPTGTTESYRIYGLNTTTGVSQLRITSRYADSYQYFVNAVVALERLYPSENEWRIVQMGETDDYGFTGFNIFEKEVDYRLVYRDTNNNLLKITDTLTFSCDSSVCSILALLDPYAATISSNNITYTFNYNNNTGILSVSYLNALQGDVSIAILKETPVSTQTLYNQYDTNSLSNSHTFNLSGYTGVVQLRINSTANGQQIQSFSTFINLQERKLDSYIGAPEGALLGFFIMVVTIMFGIWSPVAVIMSALFGMGIIYLLGLVSAINLTFLIIAAFIGVVLSLKLRQ